MRWDHSTLNDWLCLTQDQYYSYFSQIFSLFTLRPLESIAERGGRRGSRGIIFWNFLNLRYVTLHIARSGIEYSEDVARARSMSWPMLCRGILMGISSGTWSLAGSGGALSGLIWYLVVTMLPQILQHRGRGLTQYWPEVWSQFERKLASEPCWKLASHYNDVRYNVLNPIQGWMAGLRSRARPGAMLVIDPRQGGWIPLRLWRLTSDLDIDTVAVARWC